MKKIIAMLLALAMVLSLAACGGAPAEKADGEVAVFWYTFGDTYLSSVRAAMNAAFEAAGVKYLDYDANNNQTTQTEQIQTAITKGASALVVNIVDASSDDATQAILDMAKNANLPIVFFNRSVSEAIVSSYDKAAYVGTDYTMAGHMQGKMIGDYVLANYDTLDLNKDGKISYAMFKGEEGNAEAIARTQFGVEDADAVLTAAGKPALEYFDAQANQKWQTDLEGAWSAKAAKDYMDTNLVTYNKDNNNMIELVICNNDGMAEGVVESLKQAGYNAEGQHVIPVFGVDATDAAKALIAEGSMIGTVKQDNVGMAEAICATVKAISEGKTPVDALASLNDARFTIAPECASKLYVAYAPYLGE